MMELPVGNYVAKISTTNIRLRHFRDGLRRHNRHMASKGTKNVL